MMECLNSRIPTVPPNAPVRPNLIGEKLRRIITPKPRLASSLDTTFQTRIPIRKKREHCEISLDENESSSDNRQAHIRQRCDSGSSVRTVCPRTIGPHATDQDSRPKLKHEAVAKAKAETTAPALTKSLSEPVYGTMSRSDGLSAIASITRTASALRRTTYHNKAGDGEVNTLRFPSDVVAIPVARTRIRSDIAVKKQSSSKPRATCESEASRASIVVKPGKSLKRTHSHRSLRVDQAEQDRDRLDRVCATSVEVYEAQVDEVLSEIQSAKAAHREILDDEDELIVQKVIKDVIEDPAIAAESAALASSPKGRIVMDDLEEIPDMLSDEEFDKLSPHGERAPDIAPSTRLGIHERFDVTVKPMNKHTVMWDVNFEDTYAWQGLLFVTDAQHHIEARPPLPILDLEIEWRTVDTCSRDLRSNEEPESATRYEGATLPGSRILAQMNPARGIYTQPMWSYLPPDFYSTGEGGAWALRFWVPVPMRLFRGRDLRRFVLDARVVFGDWNVMVGVGHSERVDVTIEHLRREREMKITAKV